MKSLNDQQFFDLAMKVLANQATDAERAELDSAVVRDSDLKAELERLREESQILKEALPLVNATQTEAGELPGYARTRLQAKVRQTLGRTSEADQVEGRGVIWGWRAWLLGFAAATALIAILVVPTFLKSPAPIVQVAMLDLVGTTRGTNAPGVEPLRQTWKESPVESFSSASALEQWEKTWPENAKKPMVKVIYDRSAGEVRVIGRSGEKRFQRSFPVEPDLQTALRQATSFIAEQTAQ